MMMMMMMMCCRDHKRYDNFIDIGICPRTNVRPRKLQLDDMNEDDNNGESCLIMVTRITSDNGESCVIMMSHLLSQ